MVFFVAPSITLSGIVNIIEANGYFTPEKMEN